MGYPGVQGFQTLSTWRDLKTTGFDIDIPRILRSINSLLSLGWTMRSYRGSRFQFWKALWCDPVRDPHQTYSNEWNWYQSDCKSGIDYEHSIGCKSKKSRNFKTRRQNHWLPSLNPPPPCYKPWSSAIWKGNNPILRGLTITMIITYLLSGMILQVGHCTTQLCGIIIIIRIHIKQPL